MRHAKAEQDGPIDFDRPLAARGRRDAAEAGAWLASIGVEPDHALVSAARRTQETWSAASDAAGWSLAPDLDRGLYAAGPETTIDLVRLVPEDASCVVVVGHNPTMAYLAQMLDDGTGDADAVAAMAADFPTSSVAVFSYDGDWSSLGVAGARLDAFHVGRG